MHRRGKRALRLIGLLLPMDHIGLLRAKRSAIFTVQYPGSNRHYSRFSCLRLQHPHQIVSNVCHRPAKAIGWRRQWDVNLIGIRIARGGTDQRW